MSFALYDGLFSTPRMQEILAPAATITYLLEYEAAWAEALADAGVIPAASARIIGAVCRETPFDAPALAVAARAGGNLAIPLVAQLSAAVAARDPRAAAHVHLHATSQDVIDTAMMLQQRDALALLTAELGTLMATVADLAARHRATPLFARTLLQQAEPTTFGLKCAGWLLALRAADAAVTRARETALALQFGGASGTLAGLGPEGLAINAAVARRLDLPLPPLPWHTQRARVVEIGSALGLLIGNAGKLARDLSLLAQDEVGEVREPAAPGRGGSSALPHKRNPIGCGLVLAAATRAPALVGTLYACLDQEHERALGRWHAEWETLPELCRLAAGALAHLNEVCGGLEVDAGRMAAQLAAAAGITAAAHLAVALGASLGRNGAHAHVASLCDRARLEGRSLRALAEQDALVAAALDAPALDAVFAPATVSAACEALVARALAATG